MDTHRLFQILNNTTLSFRKGPNITDTQVGILQVTEIYDMPHVSEADPSLELVDVEFMVVGVDKQMAEDNRQELLDILATYPHPERLAGGPSYIEVGGEIESQEGAFHLFALGQVLGLWQVVTPTLLGLTGDMAIEFAKSGFIHITGYRPNHE